VSAMPLPSDFEAFVTDDEVGECARCGGNTHQLRLDDGGVCTDCRLFPSWTLRHRAGGDD